MITLKINGISVTVPKGSTVLDAARVAGIDEMQAEASSQAFVTRRTAEGWQLCFTRPVGLVGVALYDASGICLFQCQSHIAEAGVTLAVPSKGLATGLYLLRVNDSVIKVGN